MSQPPRRASSPRADARRKSDASAPPFRMPAALVLAVLALIGVVIHRHLFGGYFALDDLVMFQQAAGLREWPFTLWRWLSGSVWFRLVVPVFGHEPLPYHLTSLAIHVLNVALLHRLAQRWGASSVAAFVGAALFAMSRLHFPALLAATSIGELLALTFTLLALLQSGAGRAPWLAAGCMLLAVSAKESVLLVPFAALFVAQPELAVRERVRALAPLLATGAVAGGALLASGVLSTRLGGEAYAVSFGANLAENLARLFGWTVDLRNPIPDLHATTAGAERYVLSALALLLTAAVFRLRTRGLLRAGTAWWWLAVLPVLPLPGRTYLHYLYVPLAGAALVAAALWDAALERRAGRARGAAGATRKQWIVAFGVVLALALWTDVLLSMRLDLRMPNVDWPLDPVLRKSEIARRGIGDVRDALKGRRARVLILIPAAISNDINLGSGQVSANTPIKRYALESVLDDGRSLRAQVANAESVAFAHDYEPGHEGWEVFLSLSDSHVVPLGVVPAAHREYIVAMLRSQFPAAALDYAQKAVADRPDDPELRALLERAFTAAPPR